MTGDFIDAIARRTVCRSTHRLVVLPALADLQFEVRSQSRWYAARSYAGAWRAVGCAIVHDMAVAVQRPGWRDDAVMAVGLVFVQLAYYAGMIAIATLTMRRNGAFSGVQRVSNAWTQIDIRDVAALALVAFVISVVPVAALIIPRRNASARPSSEGD